jgi:hypothetical protein
MRKDHFLSAGVLATLVLGPSAAAQTPAPTETTLEGERWELQGRAQVVDHQGRRSLRLDGGAAVLRDVVLRDGVVDVDVATPARRGFFGIQFRITDDEADSEWIYLRQHKSGLPDAMQYTPVLKTGLNWQLYSGPGFIGSVEIPRDEWFHLRLEVAGAAAKLYVKDMASPALVVPDLKSGVGRGKVALTVLTGETYFSNFEMRATPEVPWKRNLPAMPAGTLTSWRLSPAYDALERQPERFAAFPETEVAAWQEVEAEPPGLVAIYRYREAPHPRVSFANDWTKRLEPQPGSQVIYAETVIESEREQVKKLALGYSDEVAVFLDGEILFRGRSAQNFRDPGFLGIVSPENDAVYLRLKKGPNRLRLALTELGGGWGFVARLEEQER